MSNNILAILLVIVSMGIMAAMAGENAVVIAKNSLTQIVIIGFYLISLDAIKSSRGSK